MYARVKPEHKHKNVTAFGGREYTQKGWLFVPPKHEAEALRHPYLLTIENMEDAPIEPGAVSIVAPAPELVVEIAPEVAPVTPQPEVIEAPAVKAEIIKHETKNARKGGR